MVASSIERLARSSSDRPSSIIIAAAALAIVSVALLLARNETVVGQSPNAAPIFVPAARGDDAPKLADRLAGTSEAEPALRSPLAPAALAMPLSLGWERPITLAEAKAAAARSEPSLTPIRVARVSRPEAPPPRSIPVQATPRRAPGPQVAVPELIDERRPEPDPTPVATLLQPLASAGALTRRTIGVIADAGASLAGAAADALPRWR